jgi:hypothetical protein
MAQRIEPWQAGYAVRRNWPDHTHEYVRFGRTEVDAARYVESDRAYWRRGPWRPDHEIVVISLRDFRLHQGRANCRAPDCPTGHPTVHRVRRSQRHW